MNLKMMFALLLSMIIVALSWILNFGFMRVFYTVMLAPFIHAIVVISIFAAVINYVDSRKIRIYHVLFLATYVISNIFFPDSWETRKVMFFGLIQNEILCNVGHTVSMIAFVIHIILIVLQIVEILRIERKGGFLDRP